MSANILITGGAGFLGSVMIPELLKQGHRVKVVDNLLYGQHTLFSLCADPNFDFVRGDAREESLMKELVAEADVVIPLAAIVGAPSCKADPWLATSINLEAIQLINRLRSNKQLVVYPTTDSGMRSAPTPSSAPSLQPRSSLPSTSASASTSKPNSPARARVPFPSSITASKPSRNSSKCLRPRFVSPSRSRFCFLFSRARYRPIRQPLLR